MSMAGLRRLSDESALMDPMVRRMVGDLGRASATAMLLVKLAATPDREAA